MAAEPIYLYVYDLSNGMALQFGQALTGRHIEGIWHTSLVLYGIEVFYGQGISLISPPGTTHHGTPKKKLSMGTTQIDRETFLEYIQSMKEVYHAEKYHLLDFNCNTFTNDVLGFLNGGQIPADIRNLPRDIMATPFGQSMRPMIDQMFSGRNGPQAQTAIDTLLPSAARLPLGSNNDDLSRSSLISNYQICTSPVTMATLLSSPTSPAVVVMYTSPTCPPCVAIRPTYEEMAKDGTNSKIQFVVVDITGPGGTELAGGVSATPTFKMYCKGDAVGEVKGADVSELRTQVGMLRLQCWPPHPHASLSLPYLRKLTTSLTPVTYPSVPPLAALSKKLSSFLSDASMTSPLSPTTLKTLTSRVIPFLTLLSTSKPPPSLPQDLPQAWVDATSSALQVLPQAEWFPLIDLWRIVLPLDARFMLPSKSILSLLLTPTTSFENPGKPTLTTLLKLVSNSLLHPVLVEFLLEEAQVPGLTRLVVRGLLDDDKTVRSLGAGLAWSVVGRVRALVSDGEGKEEWEVEIASAVVEALGREVESADVVYRLSATLGLLLLNSPNYLPVQELLSALGAGETLHAKLELVKSSKEQVGVLKEVKELCE